MTTPEEEYEERIRRNSIECMMARDRVAIVGSGNWYNSCNWDHE